MTKPADSKAIHPDIELLARVMRGDSEAASVLVDRLEPLITRMVFRLTGWHNDTEDLVQDVFVAIQESAKTFRAQSSLDTWATSVAIHRCRHWQRSRAKLRRTFGVTDEEFPDTTPCNLESLEQREEVQRALQSLNQETRELIVLRYMEGMSLSDISELLNIKKNTIEVRLHRGRRALGDYLAARANRGEETL